MPEGQAKRVALVSLNTRGIAPIGSRLAGRYAAIGRALDTGDADVASVQEVLTWWHLRLLARRMRSFRHVSFRPSPAGPAGGLVTFSRRPVSGTAYLAANRDGDWSPGSRFCPLHRAQLTVLARIVRGAAEPAVVCGDFNVARDSSLFGDFVTAAGLADAFGGNWPATFRTEYLPPGATVFAGQQPLPGAPGYVSDHVGLRASLILAPPLADRQDLVHDPV